MLGTMRIRFIKPIETHDLRQQVLRPQQPLDEMEWSMDHSEDSFHVGMEFNGQIISVASFLRERNELLQGWKQFRLRGMATRPVQQGNGAGTKLLRFGLEHLKSLKADLVWCNARTGAKDFYAKTGFHTEGPPFELPGIGLHHLMYLRL